MDLSFLLAADYANATVDGKIYVMGIFSTIQALKFPATHAAMYLAAQLIARPEEYGKAFTLEIRLLDENGTQIVSVSANGTAPDGQKARWIPLNNILQLVNVSFPKPGSYEFRVRVNGKEKGTFPIQLIQMASTTS